MNPVAGWTLLTPDSWEYVLGSDILVAPIVENVTQQTVTFPSGNNWVDWWTNQTYTGGSEQTFTVPLKSFTVYRRQGLFITFPNIFFLLTIHYFDH